MLQNNAVKGLTMGILVIVLVLMGLGMTWSPAVAISNEAVLKQVCVNTYLGTAVGTGINLECLNATHAGLIATFCPAGTLFFHVGVKPSGAPGDHTYDFTDQMDCDGKAAAASSPLNYGMRRKGVCKLMSAEDGFFGGYVTAIVKGAPSFLRLKMNGKVYKLPVVPGSVTYNGDGTFTAQFYIMDPTTGMALIPAGEYQVGCFGNAGSNGGGATITIGY